MKEFKMGLGIVAQCLALGSGFHVGAKNKTKNKTQESVHLSRRTRENLSQVSLWKAKPNRG